MDSSLPSAQPIETAKLPVRIQCPQCAYSLDPVWFFCPNCGKPMHEKTDVSVGRQLYVYLISLFLPPLGLWPAFKYVRQADTKARTVGWVAVGLTIFSTVVTLYYSYELYHQFTGAISSQMGIYQQLGY